MKRLLVVVDMQVDFVYGALGTEEAVRILPAVERAIARERERGTQVVFTQDMHEVDYPNTQEGRLLPVPHCIRGTEGVKIIPSLLFEGADVFEKGTFGSVGLAEFVRKGAFEETLLCGVCTDICVVSNALLIKAFCPEMKVSVLKDACAGTTPEGHEAAIATMQSCQIFME